MDILDVGNTVMSQKTVNQLIFLSEKACGIILAISFLSNKQGVNVLLRKYELYLKSVHKTIIGNSPL